MFLEPPRQTSIHSSNLRSILKQKAKNIRENAFKIKRYETHLSIKQQKSQDSEQVKTQNFSSMFSRITLETKKQILKKKQKNKVKSLHFFNHTFVIQKINTKEKSIKQEISQLTARQKFPSKAQNNQSLRKQRMKSIEKHKAKKVYKGNSFSQYSNTEIKSQNKNKKKMLTQGSFQKPLSIDEDFQPIGNINNNSECVQKEEQYHNAYDSYEQIGPKIYDKILPKTYHQRKKNFAKIINFSQSNEQKNSPYLFRSALNYRKTTNNYFQPKTEKKKQNEKGNFISPW